MRIAASKGQARKCHHSATNSRIISADYADWLVAGGLKITQTGGDAHVLPTANPDQLILFKQKQVDAVWTVEPWVSRLELEAQARVLIEEPDAVTTVLVAGVKFLGANRDQLRTFVAAHQELTEWIKEWVKRK